MKQKEWEKSLYGKLADYEEPAPADLWADIEAKLAEKQVAPERRARVIPMWSKWVAVAAAFIGLLVANAYLMWDTGHEEPTLSHISNKNILPQDVSKPSDSPVAIKDYIPVNTHKLVAQVRTAEERVVSEEPAAMPPYTETEAQASQSVLPERVSSETSSQEPRTEISQPKKKELPNNDEVIRQLDQKIAEASKQRSSRVGMGLYAQSGFVNQMSTTGVMMKPSGVMNYNSDNRVSSTRAGDSPIVYLANYKEQQKHYQPLSFGLTTNIPLSSRFGLTTGLVYTRLRSDFTNIMNGDKLVREQTLHYIGIPVSLQYLIWNYKGLNVYASAGGQADYNFSAKEKTEGASAHSMNSKDRIQFSVQGALGVQYDIIPELGIYAEPGVKYYFDNGSSMRNFFKDTPTNFNLQLGVRMNLGRKRKN